MKKKILILCAAGLFIGTAGAQQKWSLEQCIDYAWKNNLSLKNAELSTESQKISLEKAKNERLPDLNASLNAPMSYGQARNDVGNNEKVGKITTSYYGGLSSSVTLFNGFQIKNSIASVGFTLQASLEELRNARESMAVSIAQSYLQILLNKEVQKIAEEQVALSEAQLIKSESMAAAGKIPEGQVYEVKAQLSNDKQTALESQNTTQLSLLDLSQYLELKDWSNFDIDAPAISNETMSLGLSSADDIYRVAIEQKPAVKASEYRVKSSEKDLDINKGALYPSVSMGASYSNGYYPAAKIPFSTQLSDNYSAGLSLSVGIPIFNRFNTKNSIRQAKIALEQAKLELESTKKELYKEIQQAWFSANKSASNYKSASDVVANSEEAFRFAEEKYNNGKATIYEYNQARLNLASARSSQLQAKYNYLFSIKILDFYKGEQIRIQ